MPGCWSWKSTWELSIDLNHSETAKVLNKENVQHCDLSFLFLIDVVVYCRRWIFYSAKEYSHIVK